MNNIIVYTIGCVKCDILEEKLQAKNIKYTTINDEKIFNELKIDKFPVMSIDGKLYEYGDAVKWVNSQKGEAENE